MKTIQTPNDLPRRCCLKLGAALLLASPSAQAHAEKPASSATPPMPVVAVLNFDYSDKEAALEPLTHGLAQMLISDLSKMSVVQVVERARIQSLLQEQKLAKAGVVDAKTAARIGKLVGARYLVLGSYFDLMKQMRLDARLVEVETGKVIASVGQTGPVDDFWTLEATLAGSLEKALVAALPKMTAANPPAENAPKPRAKLDARSAALYGKALASLDRGDKKAAVALLQQIVAESPKFVLAVADLDRLLR